MADYWSRIRDQEKMYDTVTKEEGPFIKVMNVGERIEVNKIQGVSVAIVKSLNLTTRIPPNTLLFLPHEHPYQAQNHLLRTSES